MTVKALAMILDHACKYNKCMCSILVVYTHTCMSSWSTYTHMHTGVEVSTCAVLHAHAHYYVSISEITPLRDVVHSISGGRHVNFVLNEHPLCMHVHVHVYVDCI